MFIAKEDMDSIYSAVVFFNTTNTPFLRTKPKELCFVRNMLTISTSLKI